MWRAAADAGAAAVAAADAGGRLRQGRVWLGQSIGAMQDAYDIFLDNPRFEDYCVLNYPDETKVAANETKVTANETRLSANVTEVATSETGVAVSKTKVKCVNQLSPLAKYYASDWDEDMAGAVGH